jgi:hypothetical protein
MEGSEIMKQAKTIFMVLIMILICCSYSIAQSSSGIGIKGNIGAAPLGIINNGANTSLPLWEFQCNLISSCGIYNAAKVTSGAIVNLGGVRSGATVSLGGVKSQKL